MIAFNLVMVLVTRIVLCALFLPFSALDKVLNFRGAVAQASQVVSSRTAATGFILMGLAVEVFMSVGVITGIADRACAFVLAGYCALTALGWKQFWKPGDFWTASTGRARTLFWDFLKNFALGAGFLLIAFGSQVGALEGFVRHPLASSHPYELHSDAIVP